jgi:predicted amidohydrolase YtcJ
MPAPAGSPTLRTTRRRRTWPRSQGFPVRLSTFLFAQKPGAELESWETWTAQEQRNLNRAVARLNGYVLEGAGEVLAWSVHDYENFLAPRPELTGQAISELTEVTRVIASHQWPIRIHATYDETISAIFDVFQQVFTETGYTSRWAIDHAETITPRNIARIKAMGGGIAVQNRLSFSGSSLPSATASAPPHPPSRCGRWWTPASRSARGRTRPVPPATTPGSRCPGW